MVSARFAALLAVVMAAGCSAILPNDRGVPCSVPDGGDDPCRFEIMRCVAGRCIDGCLDDEQATCNGIDDDCNGEIDEGLDADRDGFSACGTGEIDCDDTNAAVFPGAPEVCNGRDDNCDGRSDEDGDATCPVGEVCIASLSRCARFRCDYPGGGCDPGAACQDGMCVLGPNCAENPGLCEAGEVCDRQALVCRRAAGPIGSPCVVDQECTSGRCFPLEALNLPPPMGSALPGICGRACCNGTDSLADEGCAEDEVCWVPGTGARSCLPRSMSTGGYPNAVCSLSTGCTPETDCIPDTVPGVRPDTTVGTMACRPRLAEFDKVEGCRRNEECRSGLCLFPPGATGDMRFGVCTGACETTADCSRYGFVFWVGQLPMQCAFAPPRVADTDRQQICQFAGPGRGANGSECTQPSDCRDQACIGNTCRSTCCRNSDCGFGQICLPYRSDDHWEMRCGDDDRVTT